MFDKYMREYTLWRSSEQECDSFGQEDVKIPLGTVRAAISHRSAEEINEEDLSRSSEKLIGIVSAHDPLREHFVRGAELTGDSGEKYVIRYAVGGGDTTVLNLLRVVFSGDPAQL